jgi:arylsulfatase A-like enzyme
MLGARRKTRQYNRTSFVALNRTMKISARVSFALVALALAVGFSTAAGADAKRPNIIVVLVDDMGYSDIGCYGGEISTPNLDNLANTGVRFTQFHNTARCCPTRAALLTGLYPHQAGVGHMTEEHHDADGKTLSGYTGRLNDKCVTIAEVLKPAGYFTAMTGKWHVGHNFGVLPTGRGFDRALHAASGGFYFPESPRTELFLNGQKIAKDDSRLPKNWYSSDLWVEYGLKFADEARAAKKPFFLYLAHNAPHFPLQAPADDIARWRGKFKTGWDKLREARYQRQLAMGLIDKSWPLSAPLPEVPKWDSLTSEQQDRYDHIMAIYAAVVERMDKSIGTLVAGLRERGELDNTLILFMSDNGGNAEAGIPGRLEGENPGDAKSTVFVGQCWATLNNTPLVRYKHYTDEGGIATPLIAHWPKEIPASRNGKFEKQPGHVIDVMATCLDVAGAKYPKEFNGKPITPFEGVSLRPAFAGKPLNRPNPIFWEHEENRAVLDGDWKLVTVARQPWRLYNLVADRTEQNDLATKEPHRVKELAAKWDAYAARANVLPLGGWKAGDTPKGKKNAASFSKATSFNLKHGDHLDREKSPNVNGRGFTLTADFDAKGTDGVIVAQGGATHGYALHLQKGKLTFLVRVAGTPTSIATTESISGSNTVEAHFAADGTLTLKLDGKQVANGKAASALTAMPVDGLDVGSDSGGMVGDYSEANSFAGSIKSVKVELDAK